MLPNLSNKSNFVDFIEAVLHSALIELSVKADILVSGFKLLSTSIKLSLKRNIYFAKEFYKLFIDLSNKNVILHSKLIVLYH